MLDVFQLRNRLIDEYASFSRSFSRIADMQVKHAFKGVTYETLNDAAFQDAVRKAYPLVDFDKPFREFTAASGETQSENPMR